MIYPPKPVSFTEKNSNRKPLQEVLPASMPLGLCVEPTNLCNFRCIQCPVSLPEFNDIVKFLGHMPMPLWKKIVSDVKTMGSLVNLNLYGDGEPFLNPNLLDMVRTAKANQIAQNITITTNGSLITPKIAHDLIDSGLDYLRVSIYSVNKSNFHKITQSKIEPNSILQNITYLKKIRDNSLKTKPFIYIKMIETDASELEEFRSVYSPIADEINVEQPMNWNGFQEIDLIRQIDPKGKTDETLIQGYYGKRLSGLKKICTTPFLSLNIKANGDVVICIVDWNKGTKVGNIQEESLSAIWFGERLRNFRKLHIEGRRQENASCKNCRFLYCSIDNMDHFSPEQMNRILKHKLIH